MKLTKSVEKANNLTAKMTNKTIRSICMGLLLFTCLGILFTHYSTFLWGTKETGRIFSGQLSDKWIVLTASKSPTEDITFLCNIPGWRVIVVENTKTSTDWRFVEQKTKCLSHPTCIYLSVSDQQKFGFSVFNLAFSNDHSNKKIGHLYAIANGAQFIYDVNDITRALDTFENFHFHETMSGLMYTGESHYFNPYRHFGQSTTWSRDVPPTKTGTHDDNKYRVSERWRTPSIQQGLSMNDQDINTAFKVTSATMAKPLNFVVDTTAPPVIVSPGIFSPFNSQNTLLFVDAFWTLIIPADPVKGVSNILRGYWAQRLLWEIGGSVGFFHSDLNIKQHADLNNADIEYDTELDFEIDHLSSFLTNWNCPDAFSFFKCVYQLSVHMEEGNFWLEMDTNYVYNWLHDLVTIGYQEPKRVGNGILQKDIEAMILENPVLKQFFKTPTDLPNLEKTKYFVTSKGDQSKFSAAYRFSESNARLKTSKHFQQLSKLCPSLPAMHFSKFTMKPELAGAYDDILLIIVFNWPRFKNTKYLDVLYRPVFPNIIYCGVNMTKFELDTNNTLEGDASFVEVTNIVGGYFGPWCSVKAMKMGYRVKGYLVTADDALLNVWTFKGIDKNKIWKKTPTIYDTTKEPKDWYWWNTEWGKEPFRNSIESLKEIQHSSGFPKELTKTPAQFLAQMESNNGGANHVGREVADVYYIPHRLKQDAIFYLNHFLKRQSFQGISLPNILNGLDKSENSHPLNGIFLWDKQRNDVWSYYNASQCFIHPVKLSKKENVKSLCNIYIPKLIENIYDTN